MTRWLCLDPVNAAVFAAVGNGLLESREWQCCASYGEKLYILQCTEHLPHAFPISTKD